MFWSFNFDMHVAFRMPGMGVCTTIYDEAYLNDETRIARFQAGKVGTFPYRPEWLWAWPATPSRRARGARSCSTASCRSGMPP